MEINQTFFKLKTLKDVLKFAAETRNALLAECIEQGGTNPVVLKRRFRMLSQLSQLEADLITKIYNHHEDDAESSIHNSDILIGEISAVVNRNS